MLEAKSRPGGRILSHRSVGMGYAIELGADFVHGAVPELLRPLEQSGLAFMDASDVHLAGLGGRLHETGFWAQWERLAARLPRADRPLDRFLREVQAAPAAKATFRSFVEGFHAADLRVMGTRALAQAESGDDAQISGHSLFRLPRGYTELLERHFLAVPGVAEALHLDARAEYIRLMPLGAEVGFLHAGERQRMRAQFLVATLPVSLLRAGALPIEPEPAGLREALFARHMGCVERLLFRFRSRFWEKLAPGKTIGFLHATPERFFPTWWSMAPLRTPWQTAWQGGPKARELAALPREAKELRALDTLAFLTGRSHRFLRRELLETQSHDWTHDPYVLGAYSYVGVGGTSAAARLGWPFGSLHFAGEACVAGGARGTAHGALRSGEEVACRILAMLGGQERARKSA